MTTAAERFAEFALELDLDAIPGRRRRGGEAAPARRARLRPRGARARHRGRGPRGDGRARRRAGGVGDRPRQPAAGRRTRRSRTRCSATGSTSTTRTPTRSRTSAPSSCPAAVGRGRGASARPAASSLTAIVAGNEVVTRIGMAAPGAFHARGFHPTAICGIFGAVAAAARLPAGARPTTASALGIAGTFACGLFAYLDDATATKPIHPAWAAHGALLARAPRRARRRGPARRARGPLRRLPRVRRHEQARSTSSRAARRPRRALGDAAHRVTSRIRRATSSTARSGRRHAAATRVDPAEIEDVVVAVPEAGVSLVLEPAEPKVAPRSEYEGEVQPPVLDGGDARARPRRA